MATKKSKPTNKTGNKIKYGQIEIEKNDGKSAHLPKQAGVFVDHGKILETLAIGVRDNMAILLIGESGTGKTSAIRYIAHETGNGLRRINLNGGTTADELVGRLLINEKGTYWIDGVLTEAMRNGDWIVFDEINAALPEVLFVLQSVMDDDGYLVLTEKDDKEIVHRHPNFRIFGTCNPPEYAGTKEMNKALLSRFGICINTEFPTASKEIEIIAHHLGQATSKTEMAIKLVGLANETRKSKELGTSDYAINTRDILNTLKLSDFMDPIEALGLAFSNKLETADNKALKMIAKLHLPAKKRAVIIKKEIHEPKDLIIGKTYIMEADVSNAYLGLNVDEATFEDLMKHDLGIAISSSGDRNPAIKGDEFKIIATYYEELEGGASLVEEITLGEKAGSCIEIIEGPNKGKKAIIMHHKDLDGTLDIIKQIYETN